MKNKFEEPKIEVISIKDLVHTEDETLVPGVHNGSDENWSIIV